MIELLKAFSVIIIILQGFFGVIIVHFLYEKIKWRLLKLYYKKKGFLFFAFETKNKRFAEKIIKNNIHNFDVKHFDYYLLTKNHYKIILRGKKDETKTETN